MKLRRKMDDDVLRTAMQEAKSASMKEARLEPAELIWWRAQLRKRQAAMERVGGPIRGVQAFTAALVLCAAVVVAVAGWGAWLKPRQLLISTAGLVGVAMVVVLAGVVVFVAVERE